MRRATALLTFLAVAAIGLVACTPAPAPGPTGPYPVQVSASGFSTCAVMSDGTVRCWGFALTGEPFQTERMKIQGTSTPTEVAGLAGIVQVSVGVRFACALDAAGTVFCWGENEKGQLGNGTTANSPTPVAVVGLPPATRIAVGVANVCATVRGVGLNAGVYCWGWNQVAQLGNGTTVDSPVPTQVVGVGDAVDVSVGRTHGCAITRNSFVSPAENRLRCWGANDFGQLGDGTFADSPIAVPVDGDPTDWTDISVNNDYQITCGIRGSGPGSVVQCWGRGPGPSPVTVWGFPGEASATAVVSSGLNLLLVGFVQNCITEETGTVRCQGDNPVGELGNGTTTPSPTFGPVTGITNATGKVTRGANHHCVLRADRSVACWGNNTWGQLGDGKVLSPAIFDDLTVENSSLTPVLVRF